MCDFKQHQIQSITINEREYKSTVYADDGLVGLMKTPNTFYETSGLEVNVEQNNGKMDWKIKEKRSGSM